MGSETFFQKKLRSKKKFGYKEFFVCKNIMVQKKFWLKQIRVPKNCFVPKILFGPTKYFVRTTNILGSRNNFESQILGSNKFFVLNKAHIDLTTLKFDSEYPSLIFYLIASVIIAK